jgi:hypothetical protein
MSADRPPGDPSNPLDNHPECDKVAGGVDRRTLFRLGALAGAGASMAGAIAWKSSAARRAPRKSTPAVAPAPTVAAPFTVEVYFTGLGVGLIRQDHSKPGHVTGVDLLLVDTTMDMTMPQHAPRLCFEVEDLAQTDAPDVQIPGVSSTGMPLVSLNLKDTDVQIDITDAHKEPTNGGTGSPSFIVEMAAANATMPGPQAPENAVNWIPDSAADLGIADLIVPDGNVAPPYTTRVRLPAGKITSQRLFFDEAGDFAKVQYGNAPAARALADQLVWSRAGITSLSIAGLDRSYQLDAALRKMRREEPIIRITVSCLPSTLDAPNRFRLPSHFRMFQMVSKASTTPTPVFVHNGPVCAGAACPPLRAWA